MSDRERIVEVIADVISARQSVPASWRVEDSKKVLAALEGAGYLVIPKIPVRPLNTDWDADAVDLVWQEFVKPTQDAEIPQSIEMRILMAVLRSVHAGMARR